MSGATALRNEAPNNRLWSLAALCAILLHVGGAATALLSLRGDIEDDASGAPAIELSLEPVAARETEPTDLPPGPVTDESAAAAPSVSSAETKESTEEQIARAEAEDAELSRDAKPERPVENQKSQQAQQVVSSESAASEATAPPKSEAAKVADRPAAPVQGADAAVNAVKLTWQKALMAHLNRAKRYPAGGGRRAAEASVHFTLDRLGHVLAYSVNRSSGLPLFDEAALAMMKRADPVPPPPAVIADQGLSFDVPVQFRADRR
ncbi:energy transducer TonB [Methylocystis sp. Sn-Cys]|uniref:energy transducer TonB n=1 Tax=Methylocystis sp. Sn-Cys TaxID=1701263 RepID=UPI00192051A4|nr:TonB family protein [Methylocystis sp. Sn-Cys]MBL1256648.1 energy transducer TonB [Methylocystis sp. Sn-Cys]